MNACSASCGWCGRCTDDDPPPSEACVHPAHWLDDQGNCRLCGATEPTLTRERRQRMTEEYAMHREDPRR